MNRRSLMRGLSAMVFALSAGSMLGCASLGSQPKSIVDTAAGNAQFSTLTKLINDAGLADTLRGAGPFTVFAPTDEAFKKVPAATLDALAKDKERLRAVLTYHVIPGTVTSAEVKSGNVKTVQGANLPISKTGGFVAADQALVTKADIKATNGVIHAIDQVLLPPSR